MKNKPSGTYRSRSRGAQLKLEKDSYEYVAGCISVTSGSRQMMGHRSCMNAGAEMYERIQWSTKYCEHSVLGLEV